MIALTPTQWPIQAREAEHSQFLEFFTLCKKPKTMSLTQWAEDKFIIPEGKSIGHRFKYRRQPFALLLHREFELTRWRRSAVLGCVQSGKTLQAVVMPLMHDLFERKLPIVGYGVPTMDMAGDKWKKELLPSIMAVREYAEQIPTKGKGSKGGTFESLTFNHGPQIKFASAHGGDEKRSGFTCPTFYVTEADKMDEAREASREGDPVSQFEARTVSYGDQARMNMECTVSIPEGRIWQEYKNGSEGAIKCRCPHCHTYVTPEFEHLRGYQQATNEVEAEAMAYFACPSCDKKLSPEEREEMNRTDDECEYPAVLVHRGQTVSSDGVVEGPLPPTYTLGFRWNAFNNMFWTVGWLGIQEWKTDQDEDDEDAKKVRKQFRWAEPYIPPNIDYIDLKPEDVARRKASTGRGQKPDGTYATTIGCDVGKWKLHWTAIAWTINGGTVIDYGEYSLDPNRYGIEKGIIIGFQKMLITMTEGWSDSNYDIAGIDMKYKPGAVVKALKQIKDKRWHLCRGLGDGQFKKRRFNPKAPNKTVRWASDHGYDEYDKTHKAWVMSADSNYYKTWLHERLALNLEECESDKPITLFASSDVDQHKYFGRHITAEKEVTIFEPPKGKRIIWEQLRDANHWLDSTYLSCFVRERIAKKEPQPLASAVVPDDVVLAAMEAARQ